mgnify:CR=1 FL=1
MMAVATPAYLETNGVPRTPHNLTHHKCIHMRMSNSGGPYAREFEKDDYDPPALLHGSGNGGRNIGARNQKNQRSVFCWLE